MAASPPLRRGGERPYQSSDAAAGSCNGEPLTRAATRPRAPATEARPEWRRAPPYAAAASALTRAATRPQAPATASPLPEQRRGHGRLRRRLDLNADEPPLTPRRRAPLPEQRRGRRLLQRRAPYQSSDAATGACDGGST